MRRSYKTRLFNDRGALGVFLALLFTLGFTPSAWGSEQNITTVVGNGVRCCTPGPTLVCTDPCGDGGPALQANLRGPFDVWVEPNGDLYIADGFNFRIRKVDASTGLIDTIAGTGVAAAVPPGIPAGEGGPATDAQLRNPAQVVVHDGEVYIGEGTGSLAPCRITKIDKDGNLVRVAGKTQANGIPECGFDGDGGPATEAKIGNTGSGGILFGPDNSLYFCDAANNRVRRIDPNDNISTVAGIDNPLPFVISGMGGNATDAQIALPVGLAIHRATGDLFVSSPGPSAVQPLTPGSNTIMRITAGPDGVVTGVKDGTEIISIIAGIPFQRGFDPNPIPALGAPLTFPAYMDISGDTLTVSEQDIGVLRQIDLTTGILSLVAGTGSLGFSGDGGLATHAQLNSPDGVAHEANGNLYLVDRVNHRIRVLALAPTSFVIDPPVINTRSKGVSVTAYLEFSDEAGHSPSDMDVSTVSIAPISASSALLDDPLFALTSPTSVADHDNNGVLDRSLKFDRAVVQQWIGFGESVPLRIDGQFNDGRYFTSTDTIRFSTPPSQDP